MILSRKSGKEVALGYAALARLGSAPVCAAALGLAACGGGRLSTSGPPTPSTQDGSGPNWLILASDGNFYGTTASGGQFNRGTVFSISPSGAETVLYSFAGGGSDGAYPQGLLQGSDGDFYGTTANGGQGNCPSSAPAGASSGATGCGVVFRLTAQGQEQIVYFFTGAADGGEPNGSLLQASSGSFYGTARYGGASGAACGNAGCGVVFQLTPAGSEQALYAFGAAASDGTLPTSLMLASDGNLYGTTQLGGVSNDGTVFRLTLAGVETVLHSFGGEADGIGPAAALVEGSNAMLYGTTPFGGASAGSSPSCTNGCGTVYQISLAGVESVLHAFAGAAADGANPYAALLLGADGNFYGTTSAGGDGSCSAGCGTLFQVTPAGAETLVYSFGSAAQGSDPTAGVLQGSNGDLYGVAASGGAASAGTVFDITTQGMESVLYAFGSS